LSHNSSPFCSGYFGGRGLELFSWAGLESLSSWSQPPSSLDYTDVSHWCPEKFCFLIWSWLIWNLFTYALSEVKLIYCQGRIYSEDHPFSLILKCHFWVRCGVIPEPMRLRKKDGEWCILRPSLKKIEKKSHLYYIISHIFMSLFWTSCYVQEKFYYLLCCPLTTLF
jgi:hypothetical protein